MKKAQIVRIKRSKYKALAIVQVEETNEKDIPWAIPVANNKLVRVTKGIEDHKARETQKKYTAKLTELPRNASEVLLLRCLRSKGARSVYIPPNRNGNQKKTATIMFATEEDMEAAQSKLIMYNNFRVHWVNNRKRETRQREELREERGRSWERLSQRSDERSVRDEERRQENRSYMNRRKNKEFWKREDQIVEERDNMQNQNAERQRKYMNESKKEKEGLKERTPEIRTKLQEKSTYVEDILGCILERLERLEEARERAWEDIANRS